MPITISGSEGAVTIVLNGEIDHHGARVMMGDLDDAIATLLPRRLTLNLSGVTFMDSSGIAVLLRAQKRMRQLGGTIQVTAVPPQPRKVLDAAGMGRLIPIE